MITNAVGNFKITASQKSRLQPMEKVWLKTKKLAKMTNFSSASKKSACIEKILDFYLVITR